MADETRGEAARKLGSLAIRSERDGDTQLVALLGELDIDGAPAVEDELTAAAASDAARIVIDLSRLEFIDSTGLRMIVMACERDADAGRISIRRGPKQVHRVFEITDLADRLPFED